MVDEFDLFLEIIDCWVWKMKMIFFFNIEVNIGQIFKDDEYIGMCCWEVLDGFFWEWVEKLGIKVINGIVYKLDIFSKDSDFYIFYYVDYSVGGIIGEMKILKVDVVIGVDGVNFCIVKVIDVGDYNYAIVF